MMSVETASTAPGLALVRGGPFDLGRPRPPEATFLALSQVMTALR